MADRRRLLTVVVLLLVTGLVNGIIQFRAAGAGIFLSPAVFPLERAGWRGTLDGIVERTVKEMERRGAHPADMVAGVTPSIGPCCFACRDFCST